MRSVLLFVVSGAALHSNHQSAPLLPQPDRRLFIRALASTAASVPATDDRAPIRPYSMGATGDAESYAEVAHSKMQAANLKLQAELSRAIRKHDELKLQLD